MITIDCLCLAPPAVGDSVMTAIALRTISHILQQPSPALVVSEASILLFSQLLPDAQIHSYNALPNRACNWLIDFRSDDFSATARDKITSQNCAWFTFDNAREIQIKSNIGHISIPAIVMYEGITVDDSLKNAAYVMDMELLGAAKGVPLPQLLEVVNLTSHPAHADQKSLCLVPCTSNRQKMWPLPYWQALANQLLAMGYSVDIVLGPEERDLADIFPSACRVHIDQAWPIVCDIFRRSTLIIANDCGPMHVAAYLTGRVLAIFGPTDPAVWFPYKNPYCSFIQDTYRQWPHVEDVLKQALELLSRIESPLSLNTD